LPCSASTVRDRKRSSIKLNKNSARAFQRAIDQGATPPPTSSKWGIKMHRGVVFWTTSTIKDEKFAAKFHYIKTVSSKVVEHSTAFRVSAEIRRWKKERRKTERRKKPQGKNIGVCPIP